MTTKYSISSDGLVVTQENIDPTGKVVSAIAFTKDQWTARITQLTAQATSLTAQINDITDNALSLFTA